MRTFTTLFFVILLFFPDFLHAQREGKGKPQDFYKTLSKEIDTGKFSPLVFSRGSNPLLSKPASILKNKNFTNCVAGNGTVRINYSPFSIQGKGMKTSGFEIHVLFKNGNKGIIQRLKMPEIKDNTLSFATETEGLMIEMTPYLNFISWKIISRNDDIKSFSVVVHANGPFFGGGERFMSCDLSGRTITNQPSDRIWLVDDKRADLYAYEPSYIPIPFILNPYGQGWYFDQASSIYISFAPDGKSFEVRGPENNTVFYTFVDNTPKKVLGKFTSLLGRQPSLPDWALGVWTNLLEGKDSVLAKANRLKKWGIPVTGLWLFDMDDPQTSTGWPYWTKGYYGNYRKLTDSLHTLGYKVLTYLHPYSDDNLVYYKFKNPVYQKLDSLHLLLKLATPLDSTKFRFFITNGQYDFFNPGMYSEWYNMLHELLVEDNFDGWMEDFGDIGYYYTVQTREWKPLPFTNAGYNSGYRISTNEYFNTYPLIYHKLTYEISSGLKKDFVSFCRSCSAGSAAFTRMIWGGDQSADWDKKFGYPSAITAAITAGLSGIGNWTPDITCDSPDRELWMRWVQFGAYTTLMRDHLWSYKKSSVRLWTDDSTREYFKRYADIHTRLFPYLRKLADNYQLTGCPPIRHMFLEFPEDIETRKCEYQYMLGDKLLVAPVVDKGATSKSVYFPKGRWQDILTKKIIHSDGIWLTVPAPMETIPVFEKMTE